MAAGLGALIAHAMFWILLVYGWYWDELGARLVAVFTVLWVVGAVALPHLPLAGIVPFFTWVAVLDVALVFIIFKGDVPLS